MASDEGTSREKEEEELLKWVTDKCQSGDNIELEEGWEKIEEYGTKVLESILTRKNTMSKPFGHKGFSSIYTTSYRMCSQPASKDWSEDLYKRHGESIESYLKRIVVPAMEEKHDVFLLHEFIKHWENHKIMVKWMHRLFMHLDKAYIVNGSLPTLTSAGLKLYKTQVYDKAKTDLMTTMLSVINRERDGEEVDHVLLKSVTQVFETMGVTNINTNLKNLTQALSGETDLQLYTNDFEDFLLTSTNEYYALKSRQWLERDTTPEYLIKAEKALNAETRRVSNFLNRSTEPKLNKVCITELLAQHQTTLLEKDGSGCRVLLADDRLEDLNRMFLLFSKVADGLLPMANIFREHVTEVGTQVVERRKAVVKNLMSERKKENTSDPEFVQELLALHEKYEKMVNAQFGNEPLFQKALKDACVKFINMDASAKHSNTEMISTYCDRILKGQEKMLDNQIEDLLNQLMKLFKYLMDKDLFAEIYRNQLAKRLLSRRSVSNELEKSMISKLKMQCGAPFTSKMEGMVTDYILHAQGAEHTKEFQSFSKTKKDDMGNIEFSVQVLTTGFWPTYKLLDVVLPPEMQKCISVFTEWYNNRSSHKRLKWIHANGEATLVGHFNTRMTMMVSTLQAVTLILFNGSEDNVPFGTLVESLNLDVEIVKRLVHSLSCGKYKVLTKVPHSKSIKETDVFSVNKKFKNSLHKFRIPMASLEESHNPKRVEEDRSFAIDAAIVRIMKARKTLPHNELIQEVLLQLHFFRPDPKAIKKRIEQLIEREYLERDPENQKRYKYLA